MAKYKKQHYVHQGYLKIFFNNIKTIFIFDRIRNNIFSKSTSSICDIACQKDFYDIDIAGQDPKKYEKLFGEKFEPKFTEVLRKISEIESIEDDDFITLSFFVAFQVLRTPRFRKCIVEASKETLREFIDVHLREKLTKEQLERYSKDYIKIEAKESHIHLDMFFKAILGLAAHLLEMNWELIINDTEIDFLIGSEPVYANGPEHTGILRYETFYLSITPKIAIKITSGLKKSFIKNKTNNIAKIKDINKKIAQRSEYVFFTSEKQAKYFKNKLPKYKEIEAKVTHENNGIRTKIKF